MTATPVQTTLQERVFTWTQDLCKSLEANFDMKYPDSSDPVRFEVESGRKYLKVNQINGGVHAFVNKKTGEVFKPASWRGPAKYVRFDMRVINDRAKLHDPNFTGWAGGYLYLR